MSEVSRTHSGPSTTITVARLRQHGDLAAPWGRPATSPLTRASTARAHRHWRPDRTATSDRPGTVDTRRDAATARPGAAIAERYREPDATNGAVAAEPRGAYDAGDPATPVPATPAVPSSPARMPPPHEVPPPDAPATPDLGAAVVTGPLLGRDRFGREPLPDAPPLELDILAEVPELASLLTDLRLVDRLVARCVTTLALLQETRMAEALTGVGVDAWMSIVARRTGADIRMLRTTVKVLRRVPSLRVAFASNEVSWSQVRSIVLAVHRLPHQLDDRIDAAVAEGLNGAAEAEPDALTRAIRWMLASLDPSPTEDDQQAAEVAEYLAMQPRLDGMGGRFWGEAGPLAFAIIDTALNAEAPREGEPSRDGFAADRTDRPYGEAMRRAGAARLDRLVALLERSLAGAEDDASRSAHPSRSDDDGPPAGDSPPSSDSTADHGSPEGDSPLDDNGPEDDGSAERDRRRDGDGRPGRHGGADPDDRAAADASAGAGGTGARQPTPGRTRARRRSRPQLLLRAELDALLDREQTPAALLTTLLGGHVRVTAETARRLVDERGADLRTVIIDDHGSVVGVGRKTRVPRAWLRDMTLALHDTCIAPTCDIAARVCDIDHATPWFPARPTDLPGRTDIDELAPMCGGDNHTKERDGWRAEQRADGTRRWTHERSGLSVRTLPATWRPRPGAGHDRAPPEDDPG